MLEVAFCETPDCRTLVESTDRPIVVGRRGTGKSALCYQLAKYWKKGINTTVITLIPYTRLYFSNAKLSQPPPLSELTGVARSE